MSETRYQIMQEMRTTGRPMVRATAAKPENAFKGAQALEKQSGASVQIYDALTGKVYSLKSFGQEHRLK